MEKNKDKRVGPKKKKKKKKLGKQIMIKIKIQNSFNWPSNWPLGWTVSSHPWNPRTGFFGWCTGGCWVTQALGSHMHLKLGFHVNYSQQWRALHMHLKALLHGEWTQRCTHNPLYTWKKNRWIIHMFHVDLMDLIIH